jgi:type I restriction enzyme M protein
VRLYRGEELYRDDGSDKQIEELFPEGHYADVPGLCKVASIAEIEAQGWSLNPNRYVSSVVREEDDVDFATNLRELHQEFTILSKSAEELRRKVDAAIRGIIECL